jgi:hypothetical protein
MAEPVVDVLEPVQVEQQDRHGLAVAGAGQCLLSGIVEQSPVGQAGQHVVIGEVVRLRFLGLELQMGLFELQQMLVVPLHQGADPQRHQEHQQRDDPEHASGRKQEGVNDHRSGRHRLPENVGQRFHVGVSQGRRGFAVARRR